MKLLKGTVLSLALILLPMTAQSFLKDGNVLLDHCSVAEEYIGKLTADADTAFKVGYCYAWVSKALVYMLRHRSQSPQLHVCFPVTGDTFDVSPNHGVRILVKYLKGHPERLHEDPTLLTVDAFRDAFPCPEE